MSDSVLGLTFPQIVKRMGDSEVARRVAQERGVEIEELASDLEEQVKTLDLEFLNVLFPLLVAHADFVRGIRTLGELMHAGQDAQKEFRAKLSEVPSLNIHFLL